MARGKRAVRTAYNKRMPDARYDSVLVYRLIGQVLQDGKRVLATRIAYQAIEEAAKRCDKEAMDGKEGVEGERFLIERVIREATPMVEVRSKRFGGATYQVPVQLSEDRGIALAIRMIVRNAFKRSEKSMVLKLAGEFTDVLANRGATMKERDNMHRMAKANQAFAGARR